MSTQIQLRRDTAADWTSNNPTLAAGEVGWESDTGATKIGDGTTAWTSLGYVSTRRSVFVPVSVDEFFVGAGTPAAGALTAAHRVPHVLFDQSVDELIYCQATDFNALDGWATAVSYLWTITIGTTASNNIVASAGINVGLDGLTMGFSSSAVGTSDTTCAITGGTDGTVERHALTGTLNVSELGLASFGQLYVRRSGSNGSDNYAADIGIVGVEFARTS